MGGEDVQITERSIIKDKDLLSILESHPIQATQVALSRDSGSISNPTFNQRKRLSNSINRAVIKLALAMNVRHVLTSYILMGTILFRCGD